MDQNAWIDGAAARAHHQAVDGSEAHRAGDAAAILHGAEARAIAEMRDDDAPLGHFRRNFSQPARDIFIGDAVKAVTPDSLLGIFSRDGESLRDRRLAAMEGRVETGDLRQLRMGGPYRPNDREIMRLMQRRERNEGGEPLDDVVRKQQRRGIFAPAMHDAMADGGDVAPLQPGRRDAHHGLRRRGVIEVLRRKFFL